MAEPLAFLGTILGCFMVAMAAVYLTHQTAITAMVLAWRHAELQAIGSFTDTYAALDASVVRANPASVNTRSLLRLGTMVGRIYNLFGAASLVALAVAVTVFAPHRRFRSKINNIDRLILSLNDDFRFSRAFVGRERRLRNPEWGQPPRPGDMSLHPSEWLAAWAYDRNRAFQIDLARAGLERQLGPLWTGVTDAAPHVRCLFAALALHADRQRREAGQFLGDLATALPPGSGETPLCLPASVVALADRILRDRAVTKSCSAAAAVHAYTATAMMGVLCHARHRAGVLSPGQFNWLKLVDRGLWYALLMPPNPFPEGAGAQAHFLAETIAGAPLQTPQVDPALQAICARRYQDAAAERRRF